MEAKEQKILNDALEKVKTFFSGLVSPEEKEALQKYVQAEETPAPTAKQVKTKDGKTLSIEGELSEGSNVKEITAEGPKDLPDGDYTIVDADGKEAVVTVASGKISKMVMPEPAQPEKPVDQNIQTQLSEQKTSFEKLITELKASNEKEIQGLKTQVLALTKHFQKLIETPLNVNLSQNKVEKKYEEMDNVEKMRYNRGETIYK